MAEVNEKVSRKAYQKVLDLQQKNLLYLLDPKPSRRAKL